MKNERSILNLPDGCPDIPPQVPRDNIVAVVQVYKAGAAAANRDTPYRKEWVFGTTPADRRNVIIGCCIYLHSVDEHPIYTFGRSKPRANFDVCLPGTFIKKRLFKLLPVRENGCWRIEAASENDAQTNVVQIRGLRLKVWLVHSATEVLRSYLTFDNETLQEVLQNLEERLEDWAEERYIWNRSVDPVSSRSHCLTKRFIGRPATAKIYQHENGLEDRDREMLMLCKQHVHESKVRYHAATEIEGIPAVITDTHQSMIPFGTIASDLDSLQPGFRFQLAADMLRPLFSALEQACADISKRLPDYWGTDIKSRMLEYLALKELEWARARKYQFHNNGLLHIGSVSQMGIQILVESWEQWNQGRAATRTHPMILTLGHAYLDGLANPICSTQMWPQLPLPHEICSKLRSLKGEEKDPWRTFTVRQSRRFRIQSLKAAAEATEQFEIDGQSLAMYLTTCYDMYPSWHSIILSEYDKWMLPVGASVSPNTISNFRTGLAEFGQLPTNLDATLRTLESVTAAGVLGVEEVHKIWYHAPSQLFNVTQLHRLATRDRLDVCLSDSEVWCDNYVEVRGEAVLEGCYVPLALLSMFTEALGMTIDQMPDCRRNRSIDGPADFSRVSSRIVLAHRWLVGFASMARNANQVTHYPRDETDFLSGNHWAKYKTVEESDVGDSVSKPQVSQSQDKPSHVVSIADSHGSSRLVDAIEDRANIIAKAEAPFRRPLESAEPDSSFAEIVQREKVSHIRDGPTMSFLDRNLNLLKVPDLRGIDPEQSFEEVDFTEKIDRDNKFIIRMMDMYFDKEAVIDYEVQLSPLSPIEEQDRALAAAFREASQTEVDTLDDKMSETIKAWNGDLPMTDHSSFSGDNDSSQTRRPPEALVPQNEDTLSSRHDEGEQNIFEVSQSFALQRGMTTAQRPHYEKERGSLALLSSNADLPNEQDSAATSMPDTETFDTEMTKAPSDASEAERGV
ncbi:hypothetical protein N0V90_001847 [Kalmusia sp. IMI 367209]|nr:hypothetical protein N0V90_001847 [Kalmusia sp. IMI 367209]